MSENPPADPPAQDPPKTDPPSDPPADSTDWKAEARKWEQRAKENSEAAKKLADLEEANKSEIEKEREARVAAEKERDSVRVEALRLTVATEKGLTPAQAKRLVGATREDLEKDADELLAEFVPATKKKPPATSLSSGSAAETRTGEKGRAAAAIRAMRQG